MKLEDIAESKHQGALPEDSDMAADAPAWEFEQMLERELGLIDELRVRRGVRSQDSTDELVKGDLHDRPAVAQAHRRQLVGLAFSGGGIRSATFCLGALQQIARLDLLRHFDYLSTVSGGGYIGSFLTAWIDREDRETAERGLSSELEPNPARKPPPDRQEKERAASPITFLRRYSNYLTPQASFFSLDTWMAAATYVRNLLLNLTILVLLLEFALLVPRLIASSLHAVRQLESWPDRQFMIALMALLAVVAMAGVAIKLRDQLVDGPFRRLSEPPWVFVTVVAPIFGFALIFAAWLFSQPREPTFTGWMSGGALALFFFWSPIALLSTGYGLHLRRQEQPVVTETWRQALKGLERWLWTLGSASVSGALTGWLLWLVAGPRAQVQLDDAGWIRLLVWGPPALVVLFAVMGVYFVGIMGRHLREGDRQWWSRVGGWMVLVALGWWALFAATFYLPPLLRWGASEFPKIAGSSSLIWVLTTVGGIVAGRSEATGHKKSNRALEVAARVAPYVFVVGLVALLSLGASAIYPKIVDAVDGWCRGEQAGLCREFATQVGQEQIDPAGSSSWKERADATVASSLEADATRLADRWLLQLLLFLGVGGATWAFSSRVDINEFSMHNFYRDRLTRPYLGATRKRRPNPFTSFDRKDDLPLHELLSEDRDKRPYDGPYPILNAALNLTSGSQDMAWQERKANSFVFTPGFYGYEPGAQERAAGVRGAYRPTAGTGGHRGADRGITLGTAMSVSGAAVSPNMGYHSSPALAFLMTVFNARLGIWMGNTARRLWQWKAPKVGLQAFLAELFGSAGSTSDWIHLSDGGFFDNLGIYELIRRRCRFILAYDAEGDAKIDFNALANVIRRCRSDFGVDIRFENLDPLRIDPATGFSKWHCAVGRIHYDRIDQDAPRGILVYVKASLTGDEPADLLNYHRRHPAFPHESTGDQWFGESQFESYRRLGKHITRVVFDSVGLRDIKR